MTINRSLVRLAAGVSLAALSAASVASAQPLANPLIPSSTRDVAVEPTGNFLRPRVGVQATVSDNVTSTNTDKQSDVIGRVTAGLTGLYSSPRATLNVNGDVVYDVYAKNQKFDTLSFNGVAAGSYIVAPQILAIEAGGAQTQGSTTTFGSTEFYRSANANDYQVGTYYVGPHLTLSPGIFDVSAAARYGQVFYDAANVPTAPNLASDTSFYQVIGAADTKDRLGKIRFVTSAQYQRDDQDFETTSGSLSSFYEVGPRFTAIARGGYDDTQLTRTLDMKAPFWSIGGQYLFGRASSLRLEGGQRYDKPYYSGQAQFQVSRTITLAADYSVTQSTGALAISGVLVDYVGGLNDPLPFPVASPTFGLNTTYYSDPAINRNGSLRAFVDLDRQSFDLRVDYSQQKFETSPQAFKTLSEAVTYANKVRPDLQLSVQLLHANGNGSNVAVVSSNVEGNYYQIAGRADYSLNSRTNLIAIVQHRSFSADGGVTVSDFDENLATIALIRHFR